MQTVFWIQFHQIRQTWELITLFMRQLHLTFEELKNSYLAIIKYY